MHKIMGYSGLSKEASLIKDYSEIVREMDSVFKESLDSDREEEEEEEEEEYDETLYHGERYYDKNLYFTYKMLEDVIVWFLREKRPELGLPKYSNKKIASFLKDNKGILVRVADGILQETEALAIHSGEEDLPIESNIRKFFRDHLRAIMRMIKDYFEEEGKRLPVDDSYNNYHYYLFNKLL